jgi:hypothetical protein
VLSFVVFPFSCSCAVTAARSSLTVPTGREGGLDHEMDREHAASVHVPDADETAAAAKAEDSVSKPREKDALPRGVEEPQPSRSLPGTVMGLTPRVMGEATLCASESLTENMGRAAV